MKSKAPDQYAPSRLAQITPIVRGLLVEATGDEDRPYRPVILKSLTSKESIDFAGSAKNAEAKRYPSPLIKGQRPPLFLNPADFDAEPEKLRRQLNDWIYSSSSDIDLLGRFKGLRSQFVRPGSPGRGDTYAPRI